MAAIFLTCAELDQVLGLLVLREGADLRIFSTPTVATALDGALPLRRVLQEYCSAQWIQLARHEAVDLAAGNLSIRPFPLGRRRPRYVTDDLDGDWVVGYVITDHGSGHSVVYAPLVEDWTAELEQQIAGASCAFIDGTFWSTDELHNAGAGTRLAGAMGHLPIDGEEGTARRFAAAGTGKKIYVHLNNTNPVLDRRSREHAVLVGLGLEVGYDGLSVEV